MIERKTKCITLAVLNYLVDVSQHEYKDHVQIHCLELIFFRFPHLYFPPSLADRTVLFTSPCQHRRGDGKKDFRTRL